MLPLFRGVATITLVHRLQVVLIGLEIEGHRPRQRQERQATLLELFEALGCAGLRLVYTVKLDSMAGRSNVQVPIPCAADKCRLGLAVLA